MFCTKCGAENPNEAHFCHQCGQAIWHGASPAPSTSAEASPPPHKATVSTSTVEPGVKGWLKFLCFSLTILTPLLAMGLLSKEWGDTKQYFDTWPSLRTAVIVEIWLTVALAGFGAMAGYRLWTLHPRAVSTAKLYFWVQGFAVIGISMTVIAIADMPDAGRDAMIQESVKSVVRAFFNSLVWLLYLSRSKRVKATYLQSAA